MAIDTKAKRASVQAYTTGLMRPPPDGTIGSGDRATLVGLYAGLVYALAAAAAAYVAGIPIRFAARLSRLKNLDYAALVAAAEVENAATQTWARKNYYRIMRLRHRIVPIPLP